MQKTTANEAKRDRIRAAWQGRVSGCLLGKPLEVLSFQEGVQGIRDYLQRAGSCPLTGYVPLLRGTVVERTGKRACAGQFERAEPDDDINYTLLALLLLEAHGKQLRTEDVARAWLNLLPGGTTWTAERAAYRTLLSKMDDEFVNGEPPGFDLGDCASNDYSDWIGAQIRADLYGWVCPGRPELAVKLCSEDAALSHRDEGIFGAQFIAALGAAIPAAANLEAALEVALGFVPASSQVATAARFATEISARDDAVERLQREFSGLPPVHTVNNLAVVVWAISAFRDDFSAAICNAVMAGWDTDCNAATVGGLLGLSGAKIPKVWTAAWNGRVASNLAGQGEIHLDELVARTLAVAEKLGAVPT